jgi:hypothetical protein
LSFLLGHLPVDFDRVQGSRAGSCRAGDGELVVGHAEQADPKTADLPHQYLLRAAQIRSCAEEGDAQLVDGSHGARQTSGAVVHDMIVGQGNGLDPNFQQHLCGLSSRSDHRSRFVDRDWPLDEWSLQVDHEQAGVAKRAQPPIENRFGISSCAR